MLASITVMFLLVLSLGWDLGTCISYSPRLMLMSLAG
jgi:hypothetical protein